ncbi:MAG: DUF805 domain-containing protein [Deltaproteobacteria bacterium]|nr:DUF805 domain-containing protein [Deltaproteobacteria bacterium]
MGEIFKTIFSFDGRFGRREYWTVQIVMWGAYALLAIAMRGLFGVLGIDQLLVIELGAVIVAAPVVFASWTTQVKRWHDLNRSGLWMFVACVPYIGGLYSFIMLGFVKGDEGGNNYGLPVDQQLPATRYPGADVAGGSFLRPDKER